MKKNGRKVFLINPSFQYRVIAWMMGISLAPICTFFAAHYYFFWKLRQLGQEIELEPDHIYFRFLEGQGQSLLLIFIICSFLAIAIVAISGLILSHRIAGPIHRLKMHFAELTQGKVMPKLSFRKNDFFTEVPGVINEYLEKARGPDNQ